MYDKWKSYDIWFLECGVWWTEFFVILNHFFNFYPPKNLKNQNFKKMEKSPGDIITLYMCTINENHMMYGSWDMEPDRKEQFHFGLVFALETQKINIWKNEKSISESKYLLTELWFKNDNSYLYNSNMRHKSIAYIVFHWDNIFEKVLPKVGGSEKDTTGGWLYVVGSL